MILIKLGDITIDDALERQIREAMAPYTNIGVTGIIAISSKDDRETVRFLLRKHRIDKTKVVGLVASVSKPVLPACYYVMEYLVPVLCGLPIVMMIRQMYSDDLHMYISTLKITDLGVYTPN